MDKEFTIIIRKSVQSYIALCLELNISSTGNTLVEAEQNLKNAIELYLEDIAEFHDTIVELISIKEFTEFLNDTEPESHSKDFNNKYFKSFDISHFNEYEIRDIR